MNHTSIRVGEATGKAPHFSSQSSSPAGRVVKGFSTTASDREGDGDFPYPAAMRHLRGALASRITTR